MHSRFLVLPLMLTLGVAACGGGQPAPQPQGQEEPSAPSAAAVDPATAATINGKINLEGTPPANAPIRMNADPVCLRLNKTPQAQETFMVGKGGELGNVLVYVQEGLGARTFPIPTNAVTIDQQGCRYRPHVLALMIGQPLEIVNSDDTLHNIHAMPKVNQEFNTGQPIKGMKTPHVFKTKEPDVIIPFKCDVHGWMNAYAGLFDHPYFAVTDENGAFSIKNLPPGTYTIAAWHERLGTQTQSVTVAEKDTKDANFTFKVAAATTGN
jgi:carboxypeptidase family protein